MKLSDAEAAYAAGIFPPYPSTPFQESMSRCRACPFRVYPSGLALATFDRKPLLIKPGLL
jgi:hypothetical protein